MKQSQFQQNIQTLYAKRQRWIQSVIENEFKFDFIFQYNKSSHFITELIQNAEDENATSVKISLYNDRLEFYHNGEDFSEDDIDGITGIGKTTKQDDLTKVGKFGIGFKSVFAITDEPEIYFSKYGFKIENVVVPKQIDKIKDPIIGTKIVLPFIGKNPQKREIEIFQRKPLNRDEIFSILKKEIEKLDQFTLLFLRNIREIEIEISGKHLLKIEKTTKIIPKFKDVKKISILSRNKKDDWLIISKPIVFGRDLLKIEIAFKLSRDNNGNEIIVPFHHAKLSVFFLTDLETHLKFIIQGPYRSTPQRDNIPLNDPDNRRIIYKTAELLAESLVIIKELGLLNASFFQTLPLTSDDFSSDNEAFRPFFDTIKDMLNSERDLLPAFRGGYTNSKNALMGRGRDLLDLISDPQISQLFGKKNWITDEINETKTNDIWFYFNHELNIQIIRPDSFLNNISINFLEKQNDEWICRFYAFLHKTFTTVEDACKNKPIIRLENGAHTPAYINNSLVVYSPSRIKGDIKTVKKSIFDNESARQFLKDDLKIKEFDQYQEILQYIIPKYSRVNLTLPEEEIFEDNQKIRKVLDATGQEERNKLIKILQRINFLPGKNSTTLRYFLHRPDELYLSSKFTKNKDLEESLKKLGVFDDIPFLHDDFSKIYKNDQLIELGVKNNIDYKAIVQDQILPQYSERNNTIEKERNKEHIRFILKVLRDAKKHQDDSYKKILEEINSSYFLKTMDFFSNGKKWSCLKDTIFLPKRFTGSNNIEIFYERNSKYYLIDGEWYNNFSKEDFLDLGCHSEIIIKKRNPDSNKNVQLPSSSQYSKRGLNGFDPDAEIKGLNDALKTITLPKSIVIWNLLKKYYYLIKGEVETKPYSTYDLSNAKREEKFSILGDELLAYAWIPNKEGRFKKPREISRSDLHDKIELKSVESEYVLRALLRPELDPNLIKKVPKDLQGVIESCLDLLPQEMKSVIDFTNKLKRERSIPPSPTVIQIGTKLNDKLSNPKTSITEKTKFPISGTTGVSTINDDEEELLINSYAGQISKSLEKERITHKTKITTINEPEKSKDTIDIKQFLLSEYIGNCQICNELLKIPGSEDPHFFIFRLIDPSENPYIQNQEFNNLCLCANCWYRLKHDKTRNLENISETAKKVARHEAPLEVVVERKNWQGYIPKITVCGKDREIFFSRNHMAKIASVLSKSEEGTNEQGEYHEEKSEIFTKEQLQTMLTEAYDNAKKDNTGWTNLADVVSHLKRLYPDFDIKKSGYHEIYDLVKGCGNIFEVTSKNRKNKSILMRKVKK